MIIYGGKGSKDSYNDLWSFDLKFKTWKLLENTSKYLPPKSYYHSMNIKDHFIYIYGGYYETLYYDSLSRFNLIENKWEPLIYSGQSPARVCEKKLNF